MCDSLGRLNVNLEDMDIRGLQEAMVAGKLTSQELVAAYLLRVARYDQDGPTLKSVMEINPDAMFIAEGLDWERQHRGSRGPLHGIPVLIKDNIETGDRMHTSAGALALAQHMSAEDAFLVQRLRAAGAVILGKTNMTEWANGMSSSMWAGYSARGGQVKHPYGKFFVGGSSTGSAAAVTASFTAAAVGTETSGSILSPAVQMSVVGIKPTVGLISRSGIIPFTPSQDTAGPMAKTVTDAAILLGAMVGRDERDPATWRHEDCHVVRDYTQELDQDGLRGARIGVFCELTEAIREFGEYDEELFRQAISALEEAGAAVIRDIRIPSFHGPWEWNKLNMEFKHGLDAYLHRLPAHIPVHSLSELIEWNKLHEEEALKYGQDQLEFRDGLREPLQDKNLIRESVTDLYLARQQGIDHAIDTYQLDAILFPAYMGADICARAGYPSIAVPAGYMADGKPFGITFAGKAFAEPVLIRLAYAFEQHTQLRQNPVLG